MKVRNKKTGEIVDLLEIVRIDDISNEFYLRLSDNEGRTFKAGFNSLVELNAVWEDAPEEPKEHWCVTMYGGITHIKDDEEPINDLIEIGNYNSKEDAYDALYKIKAWKRLKDKGFRFTNWEFRDVLDGDLVIEAKLNFDNTSSIQRDLEVCFGGEE